jgi:hypothetical protein
MRIYRDSKGVEHRYKAAAYMDSSATACQTYGGVCRESVQDEILYRCILCHYKDIEDKYCSGITQHGRRCKAIVNDIDYFDEDERSRFRYEAYRSDRGHYKIEDGHYYSGKDYCHHHTSDRVREGRAFNIEMLDEWMDNWQKVTVLRSMRQFWRRLQSIQDMTIDMLRDLIDTEPEVYVYFIKCGDYVKIGKSKDPESRLKTLKRPNDSTISPNGLDLSDAELLGYIPGGSFLESSLHQQLYNQRVAGEWFRLETHVAQVVEMLVSNKENDSDVLTVLGLVSQTIEKFDVVLEQTVKDREDNKNGYSRFETRKLDTYDIYEVEDALKSAEYRLELELEKEMEV